MREDYKESCCSVAKQLADHSRAVAYLSLMRTQQQHPCPPPPPLPVPDDMDMYQPVLSMLRAILREGRWPPTSVNRSRVIAADGEGGSFTLGSFSGSASQGQRRCESSANMLFPALLKEVFLLERRLLADLVRRGLLNGSDISGSSAVAVNQHACFRPHVDSGAGAGQGRSLIVGLGDYRGGELVVEGQGMNVRYAPLLFDGWQQRHWTRPFLGERFSLVWFTPKGCEGVSYE